MPSREEWELPPCRSGKFSASKCMAPLPPTTNWPACANSALQHGINYKQQDYQEAIKELTNGEGVDAVFEMLGGEHVAKSVKCLRDFGRVIVYGAATGETPQLDTRLLYAKGASVHGLWLSYLSLNRPLMDAGVETIVAVDRGGQAASRDWQGVSARRSARGLHLIQEGKNYGKIVLRISLKRETQRTRLHCHRSRPDSTEITVSLGESSHNTIRMLDKPERSPTLLTRPLREPSKRARSQRLRNFSQRGFVSCNELTKG